MKTFDHFLQQIGHTQQRFQLNSGKSLGVRKTNVNPKQVRNYLEQNHVAFNRFINDRLLRERVIKGDDTLDINYLEKGVRASRSVCRVDIRSLVEKEGYGTGFLIAPQILITNNHVLPNASYARNSKAEFNYEYGINDKPLTVKTFIFNPDKLFYTNVELDYTIVWVEKIAEDGSSLLSDFNFLKLNPNLGKTKEGNFVSIIQHPDGKMKKVAIRQNEITDLSLPKFIRYVTDTKSGSSGAPVFNDNWEVVAVHHAGIPRYNPDGMILNQRGEIWDRSQGELQIDWIENEGVRVSSIVYDITTMATGTFPFLYDFFEPLTSIDDISISMGININELKNDAYYNDQQDKEIKDNYYKGIKSPAQPTFRELHTLLKETHISPQKYNPSKNVYPVVDLHPDGQLRSIYANRVYTVQELILADQKVDIERQLQFIDLVKKEKTIGMEVFNEQVEKLESILPYNCEHVICQSWFNKQEPMRGDLHHLFSCESSCNSFRNNFPYTDFPDYQPGMTDDLDKNKITCGKSENQLFEPENNKGIVARAVLYFLLRYPNAVQVYGEKDIKTMEEWAQQQPVTRYEKHRNREIQLIQGNRNPFIDFPALFLSSLNT
jgi:endonuclease G